MNPAEKEEFILPLDTEVMVLECKSAFESLTESEKLCAHHLSRASWKGSLIVLLQTSPESPLIFSLLLKLFSGQPIESLKESSELPADDWERLLVYTSGIFSNMGNYRGFGDTKFIPALSVEAFEKVIKSSVAYKNDQAVMEDLWNGCKDDIYNLDSKVRSLGFPDMGVTTYWSKNVSVSDSKLVNEFFKIAKMEGYNCRTFKTVNSGGEAEYEIRLASINDGFDASFMPEEMEHEGCIFKVTRGDYAPLLALVVEELTNAIPYIENLTQERMIDKYIESFTTGSLIEHKHGSRYWIRDKEPIIESYIGFIESYRDPAGVRGEFEGFVAIVDKKKSFKFKSLVSAAKVAITKLPWGSAFEKDDFLKPDFTSLDVLTFGGSGIPAGINLPNYDDIREKEGYKNVALSNVIPINQKADDLYFLSDDDKALMIRHSVKAFEVQVGLHELLGHGSGKLLRRSSNGSLNFDPELLDPFTGAKVTFYDKGETYDSCFGDLSSAYEECRAECVGLFLSTEEDILSTFGYDDEEASDVAYVNWLNLLWVGTTKALEMYNPTNKVWLQAHSQARYVITRVLIEAGEDLFTVTETIPGEELLCQLDRSKIITVGKPALGAFLKKLQVYKSTRNESAARELFGKYSEVPETGPYPWAEWRKIAIARKRPRKMFVQSNTVLESDGLKLLDYPGTFGA